MLMANGRSVKRISQAREEGMYVQSSRLDVLEAMD